MSYRIVDVRLSGNVIRLYLSSAEDISDVCGDDWNDAHYIDNADRVYSRYFQAVADIALPLHYVVAEPSYLSFSRNDFKEKEAPLVMIQNDDGCDYFMRENMIYAKDTIRIYFGDSFDELNLPECAVIYFKEYHNDDEKYYV